MSQNRHKTTNFKPVLHQRYAAKLGASFESVFFSLILVCFATVLAFALTFAVPFTASSVHAASPTPTKVGKNPTYVLKTNLDTMANRDTALLDWRTQEFDLNFDLPAHDWYESLDLFLSAYPDGKVTRGAPLLISYNGAKAVPLYGRESRFDAHIRLDTSRIRLSGNTIKISYQTPRGSNCLTENDGQWVLDLSRSKLVANARAKKRDMRILEIDQRLSHAMTAPKRVGITAKGEHKLAFEALAAQGIAQRMPFVPEYKLGMGLADMQFLIGTHDEVRPHLNNPDILSVRGAKMAIDSGRNPKIVLTAETQEQVLELTRAFASYKLPRIRRSHVSLNEFYTGTKFKPHAIIEAKKYKLADIVTPGLAPSWRPDPALIDFNVIDPHATSGVLTLKIISAKDINPKSRLSVKLNDESIGYTQLNKTSKMVAFRIKSGMLKSSDNQLSIKPEIQPSFTSAACLSKIYIPTVLVSSASKLNLNAARPTPLTDLSRMAASGAPFDKDSVLVLNAKTKRDKQASLRLLGYAAQQFGPKWVNADYTAKLPKHDMDKNILVIGPQPIKDAELIAAAPSGLKHAWGKKSRPSSRATARADRFASTNANQTFRTAARQNKSVHLASGGLASLFPSPYANKRMIGVISADRPSKYASAMSSVLTTKYWNGLEGSVARWDKKDILMAQTAMPLPASFAIPKPARTSKTPQFVMAAQDWFTSLTAKKPTATVETQPAVTKPLHNKPVKSEPVVAKSVQTASTNPQIGVTQSMANLQLRGALPARPIAHGKPSKPWNISLPKFSKIDMKMPKLNTPSTTNLKLKSVQAKREFKAWWWKTKTTTFSADNMRKWRTDIAKNPAAFFGLLVFLAFFITALFSPMTTRLTERKTKMRWDKERIGKH